MALTAPCAAPPAGYTPDDYLGEAEWAARVLVERSDAFKCPSVAYQLAGAKKIQQASQEAPPPMRASGGAGPVKAGGWPSSGVQS